MNKEDLELAKAISEGMSKGTTDSLLTPYHLLLNRFCAEVGEALGYAGTFARIAVGVKVMTRAEKMLAQIGVDARPMARKLFFPMLENASLEDDADLQSRWAALIANGADQRGENVVLPAFSHILKQLSRDDILFLETLFDIRTERILQRVLRSGRSGLRPPSEFTHEELLNALNQAGLTQYRGDFTHIPIEDRTTFRSQIDADDATLSVILPNIIRLGLLDRLDHPRLLFRDVDYIRGPDHKEASEVETEQFHSFTPFGVQFITVCRPPIETKPA